MSAKPVEQRLSFETAQGQFLQRRPLRPRCPGRLERRRSRHSRELLLEELLPLSRRGLSSYGIPETEIDEYLGIVEARVDSTQNGAAWQKRWVTRNGMRVNDLVMDYVRMQERKATRCTPGHCEYAAPIR